MSLTEWVETFLTAPADTVSMLIGLAVVLFIGVIVGFLCTVTAEAVVNRLDRDR